MRALAAAVGWAAAVAAVQLVPTWELVRFVGFSRSISDLFLFSFPPAHWAEVAFPDVFLALGDAAPSAYWFSQATSAREACLYVGTVPLILAGVGLLARKDRSITLWCGLASLGSALAVMPRLWPEGYGWILRVPGLNLFRCPARYTLLTSLGLCLLAGVGFDRAVPARRFRAGVGLAVVVAVSAAAWICLWPPWRAVFAAPRGDLRPLQLAIGIAHWLVALGLVAAWRAGRVSHGIVLAAVTLELGIWFYNGPTRWGWSIQFPDDSPLLRKLARERGVGLVGGVVCDVPLLAGQATGDPYLGITGPDPNPRLDMVALSRPSQRPDRALLPRFGVSHGIHDRAEPFLPGELLYHGPDPVLDVVLGRRGRPAIGPGGWSTIPGRSRPREPRRVSEWFPTGRRCGWIRHR